MESINLKKIKDAIVLLRIPFSIFLMPVYWFAVSQTNPIPWTQAILCFIVLHFFVYPASNGYNSFMDQDEGSIGGIKSPPKASVWVFYFSLIFDGIGLLLAYTVNTTFLLLVLGYIIASRAYSYKGIRLKKYPIIGFLTVSFFQGGYTYFMVKSSLSSDLDLHFLYQSQAMAAASLLIGGVYPLTQIYQHEEDKRNGDYTLSRMLGIKGTFLFSAILFGLANLTLYLYFETTTKFYFFYLFQLCLVPVVIYFVWWCVKTWKHPEEASYENTMRLNILASLMMSLCFIMMLLLN